MTHRNWYKQPLLTNPDFRKAKRDSFWVGVLVTQLVNLAILGAFYAIS